jgi:septum formation protein
MVKDRRLILASASPRRREMLELFGLNFEVMPVEVDEKVLAGEDAGAFVRRISRSKAKAAAQKAKEGFVLAADTVVVIDGRILGKPRDAAEAREMLELLSGRTHQVFTGFCLFEVPGGARFEDVACTDVTIRKLTSDEIAGYISSGEPFDKAGGYAIQGLGAFMVRSISGSYANVVGLPLCEVLEAAGRAGVIDLPGHVASQPAK